MDLARSRPHMTIKHILDQAHLGVLQRMSMLLVRPRDQAALGPTKHILARPERGENNGVREAVSLKFLLFVSRLFHNK
jgi:hypothetical protein